MDSRFSYALVGLFVILLGLSGMGIALWLTVADFETDYVTYRIYMTESVGGLYVDAPVKYHGLQVGKVQSMIIDPKDPARVRITIQVEREVPIKTDTRAVLSVQGLTGIASIELTGGSRDASWLTAGPDQEYPVIPTDPSLYKRLDNMVSEALDKINRVSDDLHALLNPETREAVQQTLTEVAGLARMLQAREDDLDRLLTEGEATLSESRAALTRLPAVLDDFEKAVDQVSDTARLVGESTDQARESFLDSNARFQQALDEAQPQFTAALESLRRLAGSLRQTSDRLRADPRVLIHGPAVVAPGPGE